MFCSIAIILLEKSSYHDSDISLIFQVTMVDIFILWYQKHKANYIIMKLRKIHEVVSLTTCNHRLKDNKDDEEVRIMSHQVGVLGPVDHSLQTWAPVSEHYTDLRIIKLKTRLAGAVWGQCPVVASLPVDNIFCEARTYTVFVCYPFYFVYMW